MHKYQILLQIGDTQLSEPFHRNQDYGVFRRISDTYICISVCLPHCKSPHSFKRPSLSLQGTSQGEDASDARPIDPLGYCRRARSIALAAAGESSPQRSPHDVPASDTLHFFVNAALSALLPRCSTHEVSLVAAVLTVWEQRCSPPPTRPHTPANMVICLQRENKLPYALYLGKANVFHVPLRRTVCVCVRSQGVLLWHDDERRFCTTVANP